MSKARRRGRFIVFEGIDGAGTTTQAGLAADQLLSDGELVHQTREPTASPIGSLLRQMLSGRVVARTVDGRAEPVDPTAIALLFAADRIDHIQADITPHLEAGRHVLCDRYALSSLAYQSIDTDLAFVRAINAKAIAPDLTLFLRVSPEVAMDRISRTRSDRDSFETLPFQRKVAAAYDTLLETYRDGRVVILDGEAPASSVRARVRAAIEDLL